ncbi:alkaline phosphatase [Blastococcus sp. TF02A-26]|uniref:alkaline phosphatase D family protein n=1 Tax=Blastococcus sp. TF02A-26 TaxID=2250577 RepID=UPI000DEB3C87|nr:alkaline phosphatase D family protein [Blastococcus sp. TF02A-26]RBY90533.1 alkaline phosphatase [Blastococcus sp. TF02A-26]
MTTPLPAVSRRRVLQAGGALTGAAVLGLAAADPAAGTPVRPAFAHGVASGDPLPTAVLLWTRVTPTPSATPGSGAGPVVPVDWEVATDDRFRQVVRRGTVRTGPDRDHTVKVDATGLTPGRTYWYRFRCQGVLSPAGRTRTAPADDAAVPRLRMAVVSCANLQAGWFGAYRSLAARTDLDLVLHLGDYLYEYAPGEYQARDVVVRPHDPPREMVTLADYRRRHAQYKADPDLQALHAVAPWVVTWDDHESANDAWSGGAENHTPGGEGEWTSRRAAAQRAYAEWMPVRYEAGGRLYRRFRCGRLASLSMLDLRTYRSEQVSSPVDPALGDPGRTITGAEQMDFLLEGLADPAVQWKLVGNPVMVAPVQFPSTLDARALQGLEALLGVDLPDQVGGLPYNVDQWDGYPAERAGVLGHLRDRGIRDTVFLTGDIHSGWAAELPSDPLTYPVTGDSLGVELVCTSVTSDNLDDIVGSPPRTTSRAVETVIKGANPHVKYLDFDSHGYSVLEVTPAHVQMDWFVLLDRTNRSSGAVWSTSWRVAAGSSRVIPAARRLS